MDESKLSESARLQKMFTEASGKEFFFFFVEISRNDFCPLLAEDSVSIWGHRWDSHSATRTGERDRVCQMRGCGM